MSLTQEELALAEKLGDCFVEFSQLEEYHPDDRRDFANAIHVCQHLIMCRSAVREHPNVFPKKRSR